MKTSTGIGCIIAGTTLLSAFMAMGQSTIGDVRTGDTYIGDIRTGDMTQSAHTQTHVGRHDRRSGGWPGMRADRSGLSLHGAFIPKFTAKTRGGGVSEDVDMRRALAGGAAFVFKISEVGRLDLGADYIPLKFDEDSSVKLRMIPVTASFRLGIPVGNSLFFYGAGGGGYSFNELRVPGEKDSGGGAILFAGGGLEAALGRDVSLRGEVRHIWHKQQFGTGATSFDLELNHVQARTAIVFWF